MSKLSNWAKENVEVEKPFEKRDPMDEYYPLGKSDAKPIKVSFGPIYRGAKPGPPRFPLDPPTWHSWVKQIGTTLLGVIVFAIIMVLLGRWFPDFFKV